MIESSRRSFITGLVSFVAAPAIVRAANIMPVRVERLSTLDIINMALRNITDAMGPEVAQIQIDQVVFGQSAWKFLSEEPYIKRIDPREIGGFDGWASVRNFR